MKTQFRICTYLGEKNFENVDQFVYLGDLITSKCEEVKEIDARLSKTNRITGIINYLLRTKQLSRTTKFRLYKTDSIIWMRDVGFEPNDKRNTETVGKETTSNDVREEETENGYTRRTNKQIYEFCQKTTDRLDNKSRKAAVAVSHEENGRKENS